VPKTTKIANVRAVCSDVVLRAGCRRANKDRAPHVGEGLQNPFYWEGADGSRVLSYISYEPGYGGGNKLMSSFARAKEQLPLYLAKFERADYPYDAVVLNGAYGDNHQVREWFPQVIEQWNKQWEYPKLIPALLEDYLGCRTSKPKK
jgi:hypothetical protein